MSTMTHTGRPIWTAAVAVTALALVQMTAITPARAETNHHRHTQAYHRAHAMQTRAQVRDSSADFYDMLTPPVPDYCPYNTCRR